MEYIIELLNGTNKAQLQEYDTFINSHQNGSFLQCSAWREVKCNWQNEIVVLKDSNGKIHGGALILIKKLPFLPKTMLYIPRGPVCDYYDENALESLLHGIETVARRNHACMLRIDPYIEKNDGRLISLFQNKGFLISDNPDDYSTTQMCNNYVLPLTGRTQDEVFEAFHPKWRYNIRLAKRKGVICTMCGTEGLDDFHGLLQCTGRRDGFEIREKKYYESMMNAMSEHCRLYLCYYQGMAVSGAITVQYGGKTCYVYGASSNEHRSTMPNYLMQWEMIKWALQSGCSHYDFMGVPYYYDESNPNYGVYRFKKGFNGRVASYAGDFDYLYSNFTGGLLRKYLTDMHCKRRINDNNQKERVLE